MFMTTFAVALSIATFASALTFADKTKGESQTKGGSNVVEVPAAILEASAKASLDWLRLIDNGKYNESWDSSSSIMKSTIKKEQWAMIMEVTRKPLGKVKERKVLDQRTAKNPNGLPPGDYMVMVYGTSFEKKPNGRELVTLFLSDGSWNVLTYQVE